MFQYCINLHDCPQNNVASLLKYLYAQTCNNKQLFQKMIMSDALRHITIWLPCHALFTKAEVDGVVSSVLSQRRSLYCSNQLVHALQPWTSPLIRLISLYTQNCISLCLSVLHAFLTHPSYCHLTHLSSSFLEDAGGSRQRASSVSGSVLPDRSYRMGHHCTHFENQWKWNLLP